MKSAKKVLYCNFNWRRSLMEAILMIKIGHCWVIKFRLLILYPYLFTIIPFSQKMLRKRVLVQQNLYSYLDGESWLSHCVTSRRSRVQFPVVSFGIFHWHNPSGRTMALGMIQHLTEMSIRIFFWGLKAAGA